MGNKSSTTNSRKKESKKALSSSFNNQSNGSTKLNTSFNSFSTEPDSLNNSLDDSYNQYHINNGMDHIYVNLEISDKDQIKNKCNEFIFICDCSGSMGNYANIIISKVMPKVFEKLNYSNEQIVHLIEFNSSVNYHKMKVKDFKDSKITGNGGTYMANVFNNIKSIFDNYSSETGINILTLSDGMICDQDETLIESEKLKNSLNGKFVNINSEAIRFLSSSDGEPDTRALCSLLSFSNNNFIKKGEPFVTFDPKGNLDN